MEKEPYTQFYGCSDHFSWPYEVAKFWMIKLWLTCKLLKFLVDAILLSDEKGSFWAKMITLDSDPL